MQFFDAYIMHARWNKPRPSIVEVRFGSGLEAQKNVVCTWKSLKSSLMFHFSGLSADRCRGTQTIAEDTLELQNSCPIHLELSMRKMSDYTEE